MIAPQTVWITKAFIGYRATKRGVSWAMGIPLSGSLWYPNVVAQSWRFHSKRSEWTPWLETSPFRRP